MTLLALLAAPALWTAIPKGDPAVKIFELVKAAQPSPSDLPEGSTYNYIWAQHMMSWMVAERGGLMTRADCVARLNGLIKRVTPWETYHGFYFDSYDAATGKASSSNVYFQGWWIWALVLAKSGYPEVSKTADTLLSRFDYDASGMITADHRYLVADKNAKTGAISYTIQPTGDIAGELRTPVIAYTYLTGDITPWRITGANTMIDVGRQSLLSVWHHFTFDPFYVHSCFPELGYFQKSYDNLVRGAEAYRKENGMQFYATRMEPLEAWNENPKEWPNTEHRVAKPWTAWLTDPKAPVMDRAWIDGYGVAQTFDNWEFHWGTGRGAAHPNVVGGAGHGVFEASFKLETLDRAEKKPKLTKLVLDTRSGSGELVVKVNGAVAGRVTAAGRAVLTLLVTLGATNVVRLESTGRWELGAAAESFRPVRWQDDTHPMSDVPAVDLQVFVDGQRADRENPYAFLCRVAGAYGDYPWKILAEKPGFGDRMVGWVGDYSTDVHTAHVVYNVASAAKTVRYRLSDWEKGRVWKVVDFDRPEVGIPVVRAGDVLSWVLKPRQVSALR